MAPVQGHTGAGRGSDASAEVFAQYAPPFDLSSDMLLAMALCDAAPLRAAFPGVPFLSILGTTPLVTWFGRVTEAWYRDAAGKPRRVSESEGVPYNELNIMALLRGRSIFVPGIYATSDLSVRIGRGYGMPKAPITMDVQTDGARFTSSGTDGTGRTLVGARLLGSGKPLATLLSPCWPRQAWPVRFPSGSQVRGLIQAAPRVHLARVQTGQICLRAAWLPRPARLLPLALYIRGLRMRLPPP